MRKDFNYNMSSYEFTTFSREDNYNGSLIVKILFFFSAARRKDEEEASTATTTTTRRPAARGRDQFSKKDGTSSLDSKVETSEVMQPGLKTNPNPTFYSRSRLLTVVID